jgi:hypothetical protein
MKITKETIIEAIQRIAKERGSPSLPKKVFIAESGISEYDFLKHFDTWNEAIMAAGLEAKDFAKPYEKEELLQNLKEVFEKSDGLCSRTKFNKISSISHDSYRRHFGSWQHALVEFKKWLENNNYTYPWVTELPDVFQDNTLLQSVSNESSIDEGDFRRQWTRTTASQYGSFLNFRGLLHAPINEQGVVFLFGMICFQLGFIVEAVRSGFPDCEAKRRIDSKKDHWERVQIEFEYRSSNFRDHGHNPAKCDLIVCWEHDWIDCPIEVLELKKVLSELED